MCVLYFEWPLVPSLRVVRRGNFCRIVYRCTKKIYTFIDSCRDWHWNDTMVKTKKKCLPCQKWQRRQDLVSPCDRSLGNVRTGCNEASRLLHKLYNFPQAYNDEIILADKITGIATHEHEDEGGTTIEELTEFVSSCPWWFRWCSF